MSKTATAVLHEAIGKLRDMPLTPELRSGWNEYALPFLTSELTAAGFAILPKEPTDEMLSAGKNPSSQFVDGSASEGGPRTWFLEREQIAAIYRAMIAAAKGPP